MTPKELVAAIAHTLARTKQLDVSDVYVTLPWEDHRRLLELKGIDWEPTTRTIRAPHDDRPLKTFQDAALILSDGSASAVYGRSADGGIRGYAIPNIWPPPTHR